MSIHHLLRPTVLVALKEWLYVALQNSPHTVNDDEVSWVEDHSHLHIYRLALLRRAISKLEQTHYTFLFLHSFGLAVARAMLCDPIYYGNKIKIGDKTDHHQNLDKQNTNIPFEQKQKHRLTCCSCAFTSPFSFAIYTLLVHHGESISEGRSLEE